jgi:hypothetical protein
MKIELAFRDGEAPSIPVGAITRLDPIVGETGYVAAFRLIDDRNGCVLAMLSLDQVVIDGTPASQTRIRVDAGR